MHMKYINNQTEIEHIQVHEFFCLKKDSQSERFDYGITYLFSKQ